jgi:hypothetical protein
MKRRNRQTGASQPLAYAAFGIDYAGTDILISQGNRPKEIAVLIRQLEVAAILTEIY